MYLFGKPWADYIGHHTVSPGAVILVLVPRKHYITTIVLLVLLILFAGFAAHSVSAPPKVTPRPNPSLQSDAFDKARFSTTDPASLWVVVNKQHPLEPTSYAPTDLASVGNGQQLRAEPAAALQHMFADASTAGFTLVADSGYRSYQMQVSTYNSLVKAYGQTYADTVSARPGYSEHQTGWAVDIGTGSCHVQDCFGSTPGGQWTQANAYKYGFLLRYPTSLSNITGYSNEAWHYRYVGPVLSNELHTENVQTLEQFFNISGGTTYR